MICCKNCGTPIGRVSFCPACGFTQDFPSQEECDFSALSQPQQAEIKRSNTLGTGQEEPELPNTLSSGQGDSELSHQTRPIWETNPSTVIPDADLRTEPESPAIVVVSARSPRGTKYDMSGVVFGESNAQITDSLNPCVPESLPRQFQGKDRNTSQIASTNSAFREDLRQASSKLPKGRARANRHARKVEGAGIQRAIAILSLIVGAMSFPYGIVLVIIAWISLRKIQSAIYAGTDEEVASNMRLVKTLNIVSLCILIFTVTIGLFFAVGILSEIGVITIGS